MNIKHAVVEKIEGDKLEAIFNRQRSLMEKYHHIEAASGLMQTEDCPVNLHDKRGQARIKDFAWRMTEELGEAFDSYRECLEADEGSEEREEHHLHFLEELIDALHFFTEMTILAGLTPGDIVEPYPAHEDADKLDLLSARAFKTKHIGMTLDKYLLEVITDLGMTCNHLKNKPWKQTQMLTDIPSFKKRLIQTWYNYIALLRATGLSTEQIASLYLKKSQVNQFRQRTNY